jgi:hypothetical protein
MMSMDLEWAHSVFHLSVIALALSIQALFIKMAEYSSQVLEQPGSRLEASKSSAPKRSSQ